jgi:hypothetical protein
MASAAISGTNVAAGQFAAIEAADTASFTADALTDAAWAEICAAAKHAPDAEARAVLSGIVFKQYPAFAFDRESTIRDQERAARMLEHLDAFAELYREACHFPADQFEHVLAGRAEAFVPNNIQTERGIWCIARLRRRTMAVWQCAHTIRAANARRKNEQRALLYHWLCTVWLEHFHQELTYSRPEGGGKPYGPLIAFMLTAMRQIMPEDELPSPETVRDFIDDYRDARKRLLEKQRSRKHMGD